jgi:hypothetical protein
MWTEKKPDVERHDGRKKGQCVVSMLWKQNTFCMMRSAIMGVTARRAEGPFGIRNLGPTSWVRDGTKRPMKKIVVARDTRASRLVYTVWAQPQKIPLLLAHTFISATQISTRNERAVVAHIFGIQE